LSVDQGGEEKLAWHGSVVCGRAPPSRRNLGRGGTAAGPSFAGWPKLTKGLELVRFTVNHPGLLGDLMSGLWQAACAPRGDHSIAAT